MKTVAQLLTSKQKQNIYTIAPHTTVDDALSMMALRNIGALPVVENGRLVGIVSERDYVRKVHRHGHPTTEIQVASIMSSPVLTVAAFFKVVVASTVQLCRSFLDLLFPVRVQQDRTYKLPVSRLT